MQRSQKFVALCVVLTLCAMAACQQQKQRRDDGTNGANGATPQHEVILVVESDDVDPATGERIEVKVPFREGESHNDDPTKTARRGSPVFGPASGWQDPFVLRPNKVPPEYGDFTTVRDLSKIECATEYIVAAGDIVSGNQQVCAGMAAQFAKVKQAVMDRAIEVTKRCWRHPSCQVYIQFQSLTRDCTLGDDGQWYLYSSYEVRVVCFTL